MGILPAKVIDGLYPMLRRAKGPPWSAYLLQLQFCSRTSIVVCFSVCLLFKESVVLLSINLSLRLGRVFLSVNDCVGLRLNLRLLLFISCKPVYSSAKGLQLKFCLFEPVSLRFVSGIVCFCMYLAWLCL